MPEVAVNRQFGRLLALLMSAVSLGFFVLTYAYGREIATLPPDRFVGGQGLALNMPLILLGMAGLGFCYIGSIYLAALVWKQWRDCIRFPNLLSLVCLLPGWLLSIRVLYVWVADQF